MHTAVNSVLADVILIAHVAFVLFVVVGVVLIILGGVRRWNWIRNPWFRALHLAGVAFVVAEVWIGIVCPLTTLEMYLRENAGEPTYGGTFVSHWLHTLLYYRAPAWVFVACYTAFGIAVILTWVFVRPRPFGKRPA